MFFLQLNCHILRIKETSEKLLIYNQTFLIQLISSLKKILVKDNSHDENAIRICKYVLNYIRNRQRVMEVKDLFQNRLALLEEYREWISEGINQDYVLYLISKNEISDTN